MRLKHYIILLIVLSLFIPVSIASFEAEWGEYQDDQTNRGFVHDTYAIWEGVGTVISKNTGSDYQPLIIDWDNDSTKEIILFTSTFISVHDNLLNIEDQLNIGTSIMSQPTMYLNGSDAFLSLITTNSLNTYTYNGTDIILENTTKINTTGNSVTGVKFAHGYIYFASSINATHSNFYKIAGDDFEIINETLITGNVTHNPAIGDIDIDDIDEIAIVCDANNDKLWGLCVFDGDLGGLETGFSTDGIIDGLLTKGTSDYIKSPLMYNVDGTTDTEIILGYTISGTCGGVANNYLQKISVFNSDGSVKWSKLGNTGTGFPGCPNAGNDPYWISQPFIAENNDGGMLCFVGNGDTTTEVYESFGCLNVLDGSVNWSAINPLTDINIINKDITSGAAVYRQEGSDYIVLGQFVYRADGTFAANIAPQINSAYEYAIADTNGDGNANFIYSSSTITKLASSSHINLVPTLYNNLSYGGYGNNYGYSTPVCVNGTVTFSAQECGGAITSCNYGNDEAIDDERIVSNCGQQADGTSNTLFTTNLANGTLSGANPTFQCYYNRTGIFNVRLYLQDEYNLNDYSQYNTQTITVNVINGQEGITCSIIEPIAPGETVPSTTTDQQAQTNEAIDDTFGILFGTGAQSDKLKLIVGLAIVISITIWAAKEGLTSGIGLLAIALVTTVLVTFLGLLTPAILLIVLMSLILLMLFSKFISPSSGDGG